MNKNILIGGSIVTVVLIVLASFTTVVGYSSINDSKVVDSPLFGIRADRAITVKTEDSINCEYIGKGKPSMLSFPSRNPLMGYYQEALSIMENMDESTKEKILEIVSECQQNDIKIQNDIIHPLPIDGSVTIGNWVPGCFYNLLIDLFVFLCLLLLKIKSYILRTWYQCNMDEIIFFRGYYE